MPEKRVRDRVNAADWPAQTGGMTRQTPAPSDPTTRRGAKRDEPRPSYYDVPMLKPPVWKWEIASYFFLGGLSAGAYVLARMAARFGGKKYQDVTDIGTAIAVTAFLPCPPLLIHDLGDPRRFHYMLRVFKPKSPMSVGSWVLSGYGATLTLAALNQWRKRSKKGEEISASLPSGLVNAASGATDIAADGIGVPLALLLAGYTSVLLSTSSTPLWTRKVWLGAVFSSSAIASGAEAINLTREIRTPHSEPSSGIDPVRTIAAVARVTEAVAITGYLKETGELAEPITRGKYSPLFKYGAIGAGLVLATACDLIPVKNPKTKRALRIAGAVAGLAGGFALRWAITLGGHPSGSDPNAARKSSQPEHDASASASEALSLRLNSDLSD
jgi:formate-dependent nitrite reductase membrane component NrfD